MNGYRGLAVVVVAILWASPGVAQTDAASDPAVTLATAVETQSQAPGERVQFQEQRTQVGDRVVQRVGVELKLSTKLVQSGQVAHEGTSEMRRQQQRTVDVLEATDGRAVKTKVAFQVSRRQGPDNPKPDELAVQPIEGKSYFAARQGEQLIVTDDDGAIPPRDEYLLVMESLDTIGKPHPLTELLTGRTLTVGEHLHVPRDLARTLLNLPDPVGTIKRFELTLDRIAADKTSEAPLAVFRANIELDPDDRSPLSVQLAGEMAVDPASCRLMSLDLAGPVGISTIERTAGVIQQFSAGGELRMAMRATYGSAGK
jgi:hypothetical protein